MLSCQWPSDLCRTQKSWNETDAVGEHGSFDDVEVWEDDEEEYSHSYSMQRLAEEYNKELLGIGFGAGLEETDSHRTYQCAQFRHQVRYQKAPHPGYTLHLRQLHDKLLFSTCRHIHCLLDSVLAFGFCCYQVTRFVKGEFHVTNTE